MKLSNEAFINMYCRPTIPPMICNQPAVVYRLDVLLTYHILQDISLLTSLKKQCSGHKGLKASIHYALIHLRFCISHVLTRILTSVFDTNMLVSKARVKTREKREKNQKREPNTRQCFYITLCAG